MKALYRTLVSPPCA